MTTTTTKRRLTTVEARAAKYCQQLNQNDGGTIVIEWRKSRDYGHNPVIESNAGKCCNVSGCGFCKESTAMADVLCFLFTIDSPEWNSVRRTGGAGVGSVQRALAAHGWTLDRSASTGSSDVYQLTRIKTA